MKKCTVMVKVPPSPEPGGRGRTKPSGEEEWRPRQTAGSPGSKRCPMEGIVGGRGVQPETQAQVGGLRNLGAESSHPSPSCQPSAAKVSAGRGRQS